MSLNYTVVRLLVAISFALGVAAVTLFWMTGDDGALVIKNEQRFTQRRIENGMRLLAECKEDDGHYPSPSSPTARQMLGQDTWHRPLRYSLVKGQPVLESLGRDGARGGVGLDCDLSNLNLHPADAQMPRLQQMTHPLMRGVVAVALLCAALSGAFVFQGLSEANRPKSWIGLFLGLGISFGIAVFGAATIAIVHIPIGH